MGYPYLTKLVKKLAPKVGGRALIEPKWGHVAQIKYKNGVTRSLRYFSLDLNPIASSDIAVDKGYSKFFMKKWGYPVAKGVTIFEKKRATIVKSRNTINFAQKYAKKIGYPVIVKPNDKSQGAQVSLVWNGTELKNALNLIFKTEKIALVEEYLKGKDYRVVVLDKEIISAYERLPLSIIGNGKSSIKALLKQKQKDFIKKRRDTRINFKDPRILQKVKREGYNFQSVLPKNTKILLLDNANLSTGGDSVDVTSTIHEGFEKIAIKLTADMGLRIAGVDIMVTKGDITMNPKNCKYYIIEINAAPGLDHYVTTGKAQQKIVEAMYLKVLKALGKRD
jgi:D-alanine-D-alanine ligase-like ATP-grasp enzyme